jgi:nucleoside-diphosphate-sugar epimerase
MKSLANSPLREDLHPLLEISHQKLASLRDAHVHIVGGGGFLGLWLTEAITALNDEFGFGSKVTIQTVSDSFLSTYASHLKERPDVSIVCSDCRNAAVPETTQYIFYCATPTNPHLQQTEPTETASVIADGVRAMFDSAALLPDLRNILYVSSGMVYGPQPFEMEHRTEDSFHSFDPSVLSNSFSESLRFAESICTGYRNEARLPVIIARGFAFLGPYQLPTIAWALHNFIADAMQDRPIRILGDGDSVRSYLYASDAAVWFLRLLIEGKSGNVYNVGSPEPIRLVDAAEVVCRRFDRKVPVTVLAQPQHLRKTRLVPQISKIQKELGVSVSVTTDKAIEKTINWMLSTRERGV